MITVTCQQHGRTIGYGAALITAEVAAYKHARRYPGHVVSIGVGKIAKVICGEETEATVDPPF